MKLYIENDGRRYQASLSDLCVNGNTLRWFPCWENGYRNKRFEPDYMMYEGRKVDMEWLRRKLKNEV